MPEAQLILDSTMENGVLVLTIHRRQIEGEEAAQTLKDELLKLVTASGINRVVLDMQHTRYVSSIAFWPLLALRKQLMERSGRLILCGLTGTVHDVFTTTRMVSGSGTSSAPFEVAADRAAALARLLAEAPATPPPA